MRNAFLSVVGLAVLGLVAVACQTYDFEPVQPKAIAQTVTGGVIKAKKLKPNLMLLVDKSGSMTDPTSAGGPPKINELKSAMNTFLGAHGDVARMALAFFPRDSVCGSTASIAQGFPVAATADDAAATAANQANASQILAKIQAVTPSGGTPTNDSLAYVGSDPGLNADDKRADFVVVLTDGLPNCNASNAANCTNTAACKCTLSSCGTTTSSQFCTLGCLDQTGVVNRILELKQKNISTLVIGFGADTSAGDAPLVLNAMAEAGGFPRKCPLGTNAECGVNNSCDQSTKLCTTKYYQSSSGAELAQALEKIGDLIGNTDPCLYPLDTSSTVDPRFIGVVVDGKNLLAGPDTWSFDKNTNTVTFVGATCDKIHASTESNPVTVEVRALEQL